MARSQPPQMQVGHARLHLAFRKPRISWRRPGIGIGIQQHHGAVADQAIGPGGDDKGADQAADGIQNASPK